MKVNIRKYPKGSGDRRVNVEIERFDTWSLDHTLALIILPALLQLKEEKHGVPSELVKDVGGEDWDQQDSFDFYKETHNEAFEIACERWNEILDKMIWSFEQLIKDDYSDQYHHGTMDMGWIETDKLYPNPITGKMEKTYQMVDKNPDEHWYDHVGHQLHEERIQEGFELFGKYYRSLWD
jgi:hypothetical protein